MFKSLSRRKIFQNNTCFEKFYGLYKNSLRSLFFTDRSGLHSKININKFNKKTSVKQGGPCVFIFMIYFLITFGRFKD